MHQNNSSYLCPQLQLEDDGVDRVQGGRAAESTGPSARKPDGVVRRRGSDPGRLLRPEQH